MAEEFEGKAVFIGVSNNDTVADGKRYVDEYGVPYAMANAPEVWDAYGDPLRPSTIVIDARGRVASRVTGPIVPEDLREVLESETARAAFRPTPSRHRSPL